MWREASVPFCCLVAMHRRTCSLRQILCGVPQTPHSNPLLPTPCNSHSTLLQNLSSLEGNQSERDTRAQDNQPKGKPSPPKAWVAEPFPQPWSSEKEEGYPQTRKLLYPFQSGHLVGGVWGFLSIPAPPPTVLAPKPLNGTDL